MRSTPNHRVRQRGFTLVELLVAMVLSLIIAIAAISSLLISRQGFTAVDASSQLRDNARFATDLVQRLAVQAGFRDVEFAALPRAKSNLEVNANPPPDIFGFNNSIADTNDPANTQSSRTDSNSVGYGSDVLILRYQTATASQISTASDGSMIDCMGAASVGVANQLANADNRIVSIIDVGVVNGEPSLRCTHQTGPGAFEPPQALVRGVENLQVLYGVDSVPTDSVTDRYLRADQLTVAGNPIVTNDNWRRVRSLRIGMVLRGPVGSAQDTTAQTYYPLGQAADSAGALGLAMASNNDAGTVFSPGADGRLRQVVTFTVHLRNAQGL